MSLTEDQPSLADALETTPKASGRMTSETLLSMFLPGSQQGSPVKSSDAPLELRQKRKISCVELDDSDDPVAAPPTTSAAVPTPLGATVSQAEVDNVPISSFVATNAQVDRAAATGHSLRPRKAHQTSAIGYDLPKKRTRANAKPAASKSKAAAKGGPAFSLAGVDMSSRQALRQVIASETTAARARFFRAKKDYFLPLLPENNFVQKLVLKGAVAAGPSEAEPNATADAQSASAGDDESIEPYVEIEEQPKG